MRSETVGKYSSAIIWGFCFILSEISWLFISRTLSIWPIRTTTEAVLDLIIYAVLLIALGSSFLLHCSGYTVLSEDMARPSMARHAHAMMIAATLLYFLVFFDAVANSALAASPLLTISAYANNIVGFIYLLFGGRLAFDVYQSCGAYDRAAPLMGTISIIWFIYAAYLCAVVLFGLPNPHLIIWTPALELSLVTIGLIVLFRTQHRFEEF